MPPAGIDAAGPTSCTARTRTTSGFLAVRHATTMRAHGVVAQAAQEGAARDAERLADAVQSGQLGRVEQHFDGFGSGLGVEAHLLLLGDAGYVGDYWWKEPVGNRTGAKKRRGYCGQGSVVGFSASSGQ